jgi:hypothetical protein
MAAHPRQTQSVRAEEMVLKALLLILACVIGSVKAHGGDHTHVTAACGAEIDSDCSFVSPMTGRTFDVAKLKRFGGSSKSLEC